MALFHFGVATEANDYEKFEDDQIYIRNDNGELVLLEGIENDNN